MKILFCVIVSIACCNCLDGSQASRKNWLGFEHGDISSEDYGLHGHVNVNHHNYDDDLMKPCLNYDENCVRRTLIDIFGCSPMYGPASDPYFVSKVLVYVPSSNVSAILYDVQLKGLNSGKIQEFYINKKTDTLVLEVGFDSLVVYSPKSVATFYRKGKEPIKASDFSEAEYKHLSLTLTVQHIHDVRSESQVFAHITSLELKVGPELEKSEGLTSIRKSEIGLTGQEAMVTQAPIYMSAFLQSKICDYGHH